MNDRADIVSNFVDRLMQCGLRHDLFEIDNEKLIGFNQRRALARHEEHLFAVGDARA